MTASFVLDASLTLAWCFEDERTPASKEVLHRMSNESAVVPSLWHFEVANGLVIGERRGRITRQGASEFLALLSGFDIEVDEHGASRAFSYVFSAAHTNVLSVYDAAYYDVAVRRQLPLASCDGALRSAVVAAGLPVLGAK